VAFQQFVSGGLLPEVESTRTKRYVQQIQKLLWDLWTVTVDAILRCKGSECQRIRSVEMSRAHCAWVYCAAL